MISTIIKRASTVAAVTAIAVSGLGVSANAGVADAGAFTDYANIVAADSLANFADTTSSVGDNITCDPAPVVAGQMVNPRVQYVVGEVYATVAIAANWKCVSLDTGAVYTIKGTVTDHYYYAGAYRPGGSASDNMGAVAGAATTKPNRTIQYAGAHPALNTWHYARFVGTTTTGRTIVGTSEMFYVAGV